MKDRYSISDAEREVLEMLWKQEGGVKQSQLLAMFEKEGKEWKRQTLNTFLARLEEKGLVKREGGLVSAAYGEKKYNCLQMKEVLDKLFHGKVSNFVAAFSRENLINDEDIEELLELLEGKNKKE